jgi:hypothetical protein
LYEVREDGKLVPFDIGAWLKINSDNVLRPELQVDEVQKEVDSVEFCEQNFPETTTAFLLQQRKQYELFCSKQMDYGPSNIALGTQLKNDNERHASLTGIVIRINDKIQRLVNLVLIRRSKPRNESVVDTWNDIAVYSNIALIVDKGLWGK